MKLLVLGGSGFVGWHIVHEALLRGHNVTTFNRGVTDPGAFPSAGKLYGDRNIADIQQIGWQDWDTVVDTSGYDAETVRLSAQAAAGHARMYVFISSLGVYQHRERTNQDEAAPVAESREACTPALSPSLLASYPLVLDHGPRKVACEKEIQAVFPENSLILRLGLVSGPRDHTDRFTYWPARIAEGGDVLAPGLPDSLAQVIDARDLAKFVVTMSERYATGTYNVAGPSHPVPLAELFAICRNVSGSDARFHWVEDAFLLANRIKMYTEMPLWVATPLTGINQFNIEKAEAAGLVHRPLEKLVRDVYEWHRSRGKDYKLQSGISPEREADLIRRY